MATGSEPERKENATQGIAAQGIKNNDMSRWKDGYTEVLLGREKFLCHNAGVVFHEKTETLIVSDLHLEKAAPCADAAGGFSPYDSLKTLRYLCHISFLLRPKVLVALGDSFNDADGPARLGGEEHRLINQIRIGAEWIWVRNNSGGELPPKWPDQVVTEYHIANIALRHEAQVLPENETEISGHFHPKATAKRGGETVSKRCFAFDRQRIIMPAFGAYTHGINVLSDPVSKTVFGAQPFNTLMMVSRGLCPYPSKSLIAPKPRN